MLLSGELQKKKGGKGIGRTEAFTVREEGFRPVARSVRFNRHHRRID